MDKRVVKKVQFVGQAPFVIPLVTFEDGASQFLPVPFQFGGRGTETLVAKVRERSAGAVLSPSASLLPKFPQLNIKPLQDYLERLSQNVATALQRMTPQRQRVYRHEETEAEYIRRMQEQKKLYPQCENSSMIITKCTICDRKELCDILREEEAKRQKELERMYGGRY